MDHQGSGIPTQAQGPLRRQRANGELRVAFERVGERTEASRVFETDGLRIRFPAAAGRTQGVIINTGGGIAGGDRMRTEIALGAGASAEVTTQSAEKIYRSDGEAAAIETALTLAHGAKLEWLPQETIIFDQAKMRRRLDVEMADDACLLVIEAFTFGRAAMGETSVNADIADRWRVRRGGRLVFAEEMRLCGASATLERIASGNRARALATILLAAPNPSANRDMLRLLFEQLEAESSEALEIGVSLVDGLVIARALSHSAQRLRAALLRVMLAIRGRAAPRAWT